MRFQHKLSKGERARMKTLDQTLDEKTEEIEKLQEELKNTKAEFLKRYEKVNAEKKSAERQVAGLLRDKSNMEDKIVDLEERR